MLKIEFCRSPVQSCEFLYQNSTKTGPLFRLQVVKDSHVLVPFFRSDPVFLKTTKRDT